MESFDHTGSNGDGGGSNGGVGRNAVSGSGLDALGDHGISSPMLLQHASDRAMLSLLPSWETPRAETLKEVTGSPPRAQSQTCCVDAQQPATSGQSVSSNELWLDKDASETHQRWDL